MHGPDQRVLSPAEAHAARLARYEQALDAACGITREGEPTPPAPRQQPRQRFNPVPFASVLRQVTALPGMVHHLEGIDLDGDSVADISPLEALGPPPMDPRGRMRWQALLENRQHAVQAARQRRARRKESHNQALLATLQANDPYFGHVMRWIENFVESLPDRIKRGVVEQVDRTPGAFLEMYGDLRKHFLEEFLGQRCSAPEAAPSAPGVRSGVARRPSPPDLQRPGLDEAPQGDQARRAAELAELRARCRAGKAREGDLLKYLELMGV